MAPNLVENKPAGASPTPAGGIACSAPAAQQSPGAAAGQGQGLEVRGEWVLVWKRDTWGSYGQHSNLYTFFIDVEKLEQKAIFEVLPVLRYENSDSNKNIHRKAWARAEDLRRLSGVLKVVRDAASSRRRAVAVEYYSLPSLEPLTAESGLRDAGGFFDLVTLPDGRQLKVRKGGVEVVER